jgi:hypothetical protein
LIESTRTSIRRALAFDACGQSFGAHQVVVSERDARVVAKEEFGEVAVPMLLAPVLIDAFMPRLKIE